MLLLIETQPALTQLIRDTLAPRNLDLETTDNAKGALELIRQMKPSLILLGIELGGGQNGYILCGKIKKDEELKSIPLILYGNPEGFSQHQKLKMHADGYVAKPLEPQELIDEVERHLQNFASPLPEISDQDLAFDDFMEGTFTEEANPTDGDASLTMESQTSSLDEDLIEVTVSDIADTPQEELIDDDAPIVLTEASEADEAWVQEGTSPGIDSPYASPNTWLGTSSENDSDASLMAQAPTLDLTSDSDSLHLRIQQLEEEARKNEVRIEKLFQRLKTEEAAREKAIKALRIALQLMETSTIAEMFEETQGNEPIK